MRKTQLIVPAAYVRLRDVGMTNVTKLLQELAAQHIYPIGASSCGGPEGMYIATHSANDLDAIRKIWREIKREAQLEKKKAKL